MADAFEIRDSGIQVPLERIERLHDGAFAINDKGIVRYWNVGAQRLFGYSENDVLGDPLEVILNDTVKPYHKRLVDGFFLDPTVKKMSERASAFEGKGKRDSTVWAQIALLPIETKGGELLALALLDKAQPPGGEREAAQPSTAGQMFMAYFIKSSQSKQALLLAIAIGLIISLVGLIVAILIAG